MPNTVRTCAQLVLAALALALASAAAQPKGTPLEVAFDQRGPVKLRGYLASAGSFLYETTTVENVSGRPITAIEFGVLLVEPDNPANRQLLRSKAPISLRPGGTLENVRVDLLTAAELQAFEGISARPKVTLGVLAVEFADGRRWRFELEEDAVGFKAGASTSLPPQK